MARPDKPGKIPKAKSRIGGLDTRIVWDKKQVTGDEVKKPWLALTSESLKNGGTELNHKRTISSKTFLMPDKSYQLAIGLGPIHYEDNNSLKEIDLTLIDKGSYYEVTKGFYKLKVYKGFVRYV